MSIQTLSNPTRTKNVGFAASGSIEGGWTPYDSGDAALIGTAGVHISGPGRLRGLGASNTSAVTPYYVVLCDKNSAPIAGDPVVANIPIDATTNWVGSCNTIDFGVDGAVFTLGIAYAISTSPHVVALAIADSCFVWGFYKVA